MWIQGLRNEGYRRNREAEAGFSKYIDRACLLHLSAVKAFPPNVLEDDGAVLEDEVQHVG